MNDRLPPLRWRAVVFILPEPDVARTIPTTEPTDLLAGDSWEWDRSVPDFPASSWDLSYHFLGPERFTITAQKDGDTFQIRVPASETTMRSAGPYRLVGRVTDGTDTYTVYEGPVVIRPDPATSVPTLSHAERTLAVIEAAIEGRLTADIEDYQVAGRAVKKIPIAELVKLRGIYRAEVWRARNPGRFGPSVEVVFGRP